MDFDKRKREAEEKGGEKSQEELDKLKVRLGGFNSGELSTTGARRQEKQRDSQGNPPGHGAEAAKSGRSGATPVMDSGKADIGEPDAPRDEEKIREPGPEDEQVQQAAAEQRGESRREAVLEQNPVKDKDPAKDAA